MTPLDPTLLLGSCRAVPTVHTLPSAVVSRIGFAVWQLNGSGRGVRNRDVLAMLIMLKAPTTSAAMVELLTRPHAELRSSVARLPTGRLDGRLQPDERQLWMELPVPVTHRLNLLVDLAHDANFRTTRRQVVSALVLHALPVETAALGQLLDDYRGLRAQDAVVPGLPLSAVLDPTAPRPGRRPMR